MGHKADIKRNLKMNVVCEEKKYEKTSKSISIHPVLGYIDAAKLLTLHIAYTSLNFKNQIH